MKRKIGLALAVILVGVFVVVYAQAKGEKVEPTSTPVSSSISASSAPVTTEEPAASTEPTAGDGVEDEPVNQEVEDHGPSNEGAAYEPEVDQQDSAAQDEQWIQDMMAKWGVSREEAEKALNEATQNAQQAAEEEKERIAARQEADRERMAQEQAQTAKESDEWYMERYGITFEEALGKSSEELYKLFVQKHQGG